MTARGAMLPPTRAVCPASIAAVRAGAPLPRCCGKCTKSAAATPPVRRRRRAAA